ncbi:stage V sporulation protein AD [Alicyclobacillus vulcanalis]|uniref:Stage V sporulation protein AD n=1 Tax=Alicyclobacillus vulcanalis TaxID=252246 RepID=A0A1N7KLG3_9BACL|nr:stage V sporulation protein AD [Alicyclobacillus vulcanalis]SIS62407.1 stage V sporulation protein AD [Alicyclobacillus vulcanalis]
MARLGRSTWAFGERQVAVMAAATVAGSLEGQGPLSDAFDVVLDDDRVGQDTWERAEQWMFRRAAGLACEKAGTPPESLDLVIGADLNAQLTSFFIGLRDLARPMLGVYSACASICEALAVSGLAVSTGFADVVLAGTSSHTCTAERQFRYPTEYGVQRPPTAQRTVTGAGAAVIARGRGPWQITHATIGEITDFGVKSPWEMGAAMAPAACDTLRRHLDDTGRSLDDYDLVVTGDLGRVGSNILRNLLVEEGVAKPDIVAARVFDCGALIYREDQPEVFSGGSGAACSTLVTFGHLFREMQRGRIRRLLLCATGALLSQVSAQQGETIPAISHAIAFERGD